MELTQGHRHLIRKAAVFGLTSGIGWLTSVVILWFLVHAGLTTVFWASWLGDLCAVTYVYIVSVRSIFRHSGRYLYAKFAVWLVYQFFMINCIAYGTSSLSHWALTRGLLDAASTSATLAKIVITPLTLLLNFIFANFLLERVNPLPAKERSSD